MNKVITSGVKQREVTAQNCSVGYTVVWRRVLQHVYISLSPHKTGVQFAIFHKQHLLNELLYATMIAYSKSDAYDSRGLV